MGWSICSGTEPPVAGEPLVKKQAPIHRQCSFGALQTHLASPRGQCTAVAPSPRKDPPTPGLQVVAPPGATPVATSDFQAQISQSPFSGQRAYYTSNEREWFECIVIRQCTDGGITVTVNSPENLATRFRKFFVRKVPKDKVATRFCKKPAVKAAKWFVCAAKEKLTNHLKRTKAKEKAIAANAAAQKVAAESAASEKAVEKMAAAKKEDDKKTAEDKVAHEKAALALVLSCLEKAAVEKVAAETAAAVKAAAEKAAEEKVVADNAGAVKAAAKRAEEEPVAQAYGLFPISELL